MFLAQFHISLQCWSTYPTVLHPQQGYVEDGGPISPRQFHPSEHILYSSLSYSLLFPANNILDKKNPIIS